MMDKRELQVVKKVLKLMTMGQLTTLTDEYAIAELLGIDPENRHPDIADVSLEAHQAVYQFVMS